jgi:hypothetical protein
MLEKNPNLFSPGSSPLEFIMKTQLFGSSRCMSAINFAIFNTSCKPALTATLKNESYIKRYKRASELSESWNFLWKFEEISNFQFRKI